MNQTLSKVAKSITPPVIWSAYLRLRGRTQMHPWTRFGNIITCVDVAPLFEGKFAEVYAKYYPLERFRPIEQTRYRQYNICYFANLCRDIPGDFLCAGVSWGLMPRVVFDFVDFPALGKTLHLVDPFEGIVSKRPGDLSSRYNRDSDYVLRQYPPAAPIILHRKRIPLDEMPGKLAFVFTDTGDPVVDAESMPSFYEALSPGGVIISDQYADDLQRYAPVFDRLGVRPLWLPSGQGVIIKQ